MKQYRTLNDGEFLMEGDEFWRLDRTWIPATEIGKKVTSYTHKMYRRPLTETSSQTTDTCPDCSNIPCDCGLPAGYEVDIRYAANFAPHIKVVEVSKVAQIIEQRDRLADLVKQFIYILDITEESDSGRLFHPTNITSCRAGDLQKAGELVEALRRASR